MSASTNRPLVLDVDGVFADFVGHLLTTIGSTLDREKIISYRIWDYISQSEKDTAKAVLQDPDWWYSIPPFDYTLECVRSLRKEHGDHVVWATSPWRSCAGWHAARWAWITRYAGRESDSMFAGDNKYVISGFLYLDDRPSVLDDVQDHTSGDRLRLLVDRSYNRDSTRHTRVTLSETGFHEVDPVC